MSITLSHIDFDSQGITDKDEEEMDREDARQQMEIKEFLENELDDEELLYDTFNQTNNNNESHISNQRTYGENRFLTLQMKPSSYLHIPNQKVEYSNENIPQNRNGYLDPGQLNYYRSNNLREQNTEPFASKNVPHIQNSGSNNSLELSRESFNQEEMQQTQLRVLYEARGRKIEELQKYIESSSEEYEKDIRVLKHQISALTSERESFQVSNGQLQELLKQHKLDIDSLHTQIEALENDKVRLSKTISELNEKLFISDTTIDSLQQQIHQMNQSESLSRARAQHESILSTMRQKHENEILTLNEKLDDIKQALAWKTEDVNRYKEMLDSNSSVSEIGILRQRLATEENKTKEFNEQLEQCQKENEELVEQCRIYTDLLKSHSSHFSSTPYDNVNGIIGKRRLLDFKTPVSSRIGSLRRENVDTTPTSGDSAMRKELVKALALNHEKRLEITQLKEELSKLHKGIRQQPPTITISDSACVKCLQHEGEKKLKVEENKQLIEDNQKLVLGKTDLETNIEELKTNLREMIKSFDAEKMKMKENQENAVLKLLDDTKQRVTEEIKQKHLVEIKKYEEEMGKLNGELLFTKEEYIRLSDDLKTVRQNLITEFDQNKQIEIDELKLDTENKHKEEKHLLELELNKRFLGDLDDAKRKIEIDVKAECQAKHEQDIILAKIEWMEEVEKKTEKDIEEAFNNGKLNCTCKEKIQQLEEELASYEDKLISRNDVILEYESKEQRWKKTEQELLTKVDSLSTKLNENNKSQTSLILNDIMTHPDSSYGNRDNCRYCKEWRDKHEELSLENKNLTKSLEETKDKYQSLQNHNFSSDFLKNNSLGLDSSGYESFLEKSKSFSPDTEKHIEFIMKSKLKLWNAKETHYKEEIEKLLLSIETWKIKYDNNELKRKESENQLNICEKGLTNCKKDNENLKKLLNSCEKNLEITQRKVESTKQELEKEFSEQLRQAIINEQKKMQAESSKLKEDALKAENELIKTQLLTDIQNSNNLNTEVKNIRDEYEKTIRELKQGFREKLTRINEVKKTWLREEEQKRKLLQDNMQKDIKARLQILENEHQKQLYEEKQKWNNEIECLLEQINSTKLELEKDIRQQKECFIKEKEKLVFDHKHEEKELEVKIAELQDDLQQIKLLNENLEEKINLQNVEHNEKLKSLQRKTEEIEKEKEERVKEAYKKGVTDSQNQEKTHVIEQVRKLYLQTLQEINNDVMNHVHVTRQLAANQIKEAAHCERRNILKKLKQKNQQHLRNPNDTNKINKINNHMQSSETLRDREEPKKNSHENEFLLKNNSIRDSTMEQKIRSPYSENHTKVNDWIDFQLHPRRDGSPYFNVNKNSPLDKIPQNIKHLSNT